MTISTLKSGQTAWIWTLCFVCSLILVMFAYYMYPVPDGDAIFFIPTIKTYAITGTLENKLVDMSFTTDPRGLGRFLYHTPGTPLFFGSLLSLFGVKSYQNVLILLSLARCASVFLFAKSVLLVLQRNVLPAGIHRVVMPSILVVSNAFFLFASNGRPEILSILIISVALLSALSIRKTFKKNLVIQICLGLLFPVSIVNGLVGVIFYALYLSFSIPSWRKKALYLLFGLFFSALFFLASYSLAGVDLQEAFHGLMMQGQSKFSDNGFFTVHQILFYFGTWGLFGILSILFLAKRSSDFLGDKANYLADKMWLIISLIALFYAVFSFGLRQPNSHYQLYAFICVYQILSLQLVLQAAGHGHKLFSAINICLIYAAIALSLLQPIKTILLFPYYLSSGSSYATMKQKFEDLKPANCSMVYTTSVAMLDESQFGSIYSMNGAGGINKTERIKKYEKDSSCVMAIVQEANSNSPLPTEANLVADFSDRSPYTGFLRSMRLLNSPKGYSFKVYRSDLGM